MAEEATNVKNVKEAIRRLLDGRDLITNRAVVAALDGEITRQAVHSHLAELVESGVLEMVGAGRSVRYRRRYQWVRRYQVAGLDEAAVWNELHRELPALTALDKEQEFHVKYLVTEMVNNAIDHSNSSEVEVRFRTDGRRLHLEVLDDGIGVFANIVAGTDANHLLEAAQELTVGKVTTMPERHSGEGIFFSSRSSQLFQIDANEVRLTVDNERDDWALGTSRRDQGSAVVFEVDAEQPIPLAELFERFAGEDHRFDTTSTTIKLFEAGVSFVSRSEARRLASRLARFRRVELDFAGVENVGQGFVDELLRVWATEHPDIEIITRNTNPAVRFMIDRGSSRT